MLALFQKSFKDFLDPVILKRALLPILLAGAILGGLIYLLESSLISLLVTLLSHIPWVPSSWIDTLTDKFMGFVIFFELTTAFALLLVGLVSERVVDRINQKHYRLPKEGFGTAVGSILTALRSTMLYLFLLLILSPLLFLPYLNIPIHILLWMTMLKMPLFYDACAFYADKKRFKQLLKTHKKEFRLLALFGAITLFIPFVGLFSYLFLLILFANFALAKLQVSG